MNDFSQEGLGTDNKMSRRQFLKNAAAAAGAVIVGEKVIKGVGDLLKDYDPNHIWPIPEATQAEPAGQGTVSGGSDTQVTQAELAGAQANQVGQEVTAVGPVTQPEINKSDITWKKIEQDDTFDALVRQGDVRQSIDPYLKGVLLKGPDGNIFAFLGPQAIIGASSKDLFGIKTRLPVGYEISVGNSRLIKQYIDENSDRVKVRVTGQSDPINNGLSTWFQVAEGEMVTRYNLDGLWPVNAFVSDNWVKEEAQQGNILDNATKFALGWGLLGKSSIEENSNQREAINKAQEKERERVRALMEGTEGNGKNWWERFRGWFGRNFRVVIKRPTTDEPVSDGDPER